MTEEKHKIDDEVNPHGLADHKALRKMGTERLKELLDQTYEMRKDRLKSTPSASPSVNHYIDEWITVVEENSIVAKTNPSKNFHILPPLNFGPNSGGPPLKERFFRQFPPCLYKSQSLDFPSSFGNPS